MNIIAYVDSAGDYLFKYTDGYDLSYYFMLDGTMNDLCNLSGTNTYEITGDDEGLTDIEIIACTCDDEVYECECENNCIDVFGFMIDDSSTISNIVALFIGVGHYFYDSCNSSSSCYINDNEDGCTVELTLLEKQIQMAVIIFIMCVSIMWTLHHQIKNIQYITNII